jgi:hypothetical protein
MKQRFKIIETTPDKNGFVIIAIKEDEHGKFESREDALEYLHKHHGKVQNGERDTTNDDENVDYRGYR